jgi:hypothetical protein
MSEKRNNEKPKPKKQRTRELLEGLRKDLQMLLLETEGLIVLTAEKYKIRHALKPTGATKPRRIDANSRNDGRVRLHPPAALGPNSS